MAGVPHISGPAAVRAASVRAGGPPPAAGGHGSPHAVTPQAGTAGHWIVKGGKQVLIHAVGPGQWVEGTKPGFKAPPKPKLQESVNITRARGGAPHTPGANSPNNPLNQNGNWLTPMTPNQIKTQATSEMNQIYQPLTSALDNQTSQEEAIYAKQQSDNQYYLNWMNQKSTALQASQNAIDAQTNQLEQQLTGNATSVLGAQTSALTAAANARPGNVSNEAQAFAPNSVLGGYLATGQQSAMSMENAFAQNNLNDERTAQAAFGAEQLNAGAAIQGNEAKESAAFQTAMTKIASTKATALSKETSDIEKEIARLEGVNISVSENNRNYATAAAKLGVSVAQANSEIASRAAATRLNAAKFGLDQQKFANTIAEQSIKNNLAQQGLNIKDKNLQIASTKLILQTLNTNSEIALRNAEIYAKQHGALTPHELNTYRESIDKATGQINDLIGKYGLTPQQAYQAVLDGGFYGKGLNSKGGTVDKHISVPRMQNQSLLNAAFNLRQGGSGLTAGDMRYLNSLFIPSSTVQGWYGGRIQGTGGQSTGTQTSAGMGHQ